MSARAGPRRLRAGELLDLAGAGCLTASLLVPWYDSPIGSLDVWDTFGPGIALLLAALCAGLAVAATALTERTPALPVATAVWCVPVGVVAVIAAAVRVLERPDHATGLQSGPWLALVGAGAVLMGAWLALRDERPSLYEPAKPPARPRP